MPKLAQGKGLRQPLDLKALLSRFKPAAKKRASAAAAVTVSSWFFFEVSEFKAKVMHLTFQGGKIEIADVQKFTSMDESGTPQEMDWVELAAWIQHYISLHSQDKNYLVRVLLIGANIFIGETDNPGVSEKELDETLTWQIADQLPFASEDFKMHYEVRDNNVLVSAVEGSFYKKVVQCFHSAKIYPQSITALPFAYEALIQHEALALEENIALVRIGRHHTYVLDFKGKKFHSMREIPFGSEQITEAMIGTLTLDDQKVEIGYEEAEVLKKNLGIPTPNLEPDPEEPRNSQLALKLRPALERLMSDINTTISSFERKHDGVSIQQIYLVGGGSLMSGLNEYFENKLGCSTKMLDVSAIFKNAAQSDLEMLGLLYLAGGKFNFAGSAAQARDGFETAKSVVKKGTFAVTVILNFFVVVVLVQIAFAGFELNAVKKKYENIGANEEKIKQVDQLLDQITKIATTHRAEIIQEPSLGEALREISLLVPRTVTFKEMNFNKVADFELSFTGTVTGGGRSQDIVLSSFLENLDASSVFEFSRLESRSGEAGDTQKQVSFKILTQLVAA